MKKLSTNIILVHLGDKKIPYILYTIYHLIYFKHKNIYLIANKKTIKFLKKYKISNSINLIDVSDLKKTYEHNQFLSKTKLDKKWDYGFWQNTSERFFYIESLSREKKLQNIIHLENDNLIFDNLEKYIKIFYKNYFIGLTFLNKDFCIPSFVYIKNYKYMKIITNEIYKKNTSFFQFKKSNDINDMKVLGQLKYKNKKISLLPTVNKEMISYSQHPVDKEFYNCFEKFRCLFDAAAIGQKIDGLSTTANNGKKREKEYINKANIIDPTHFNIVFKKIKKLKKPYLFVNNKLIPLINIHLHSKRNHIFFNKLKFKLN